MDVLKMMGLLKYLDRHALTAEALTEILVTVGFAAPADTLVRAAQLIKDRGITEGVLHLIPSLKKVEAANKPENITVTKCPQCGALVILEPGKR